VPLQVYAESYTLSGCTTARYCGVFRRVAAQCLCDECENCPNMELARPGWTDATLCDGAPIYQLEGGEGLVLYRYMPWRGGSQWAVTDSDDGVHRCGGGSQYYHSRLADSDLAPSAPDAVIYGWSDPGGYDSTNEQGAFSGGTINIVMGDRPLEQPSPGDGGHRRTQAE
jgi:hypothetical protein